MAGEVSKSDMMWQMQEDRVGALWQDGRRKEAHHSFMKPQGLLEGIWIRVISAERYEEGRADVLPGGACRCECEVCARSCI
jgi:hypothetical protein